LHGLLGQRKRWINGSFFAFEAVKKGLNTESKGDCCLKLQIFYLTLMNMLAFVAPAMFLFTIHIAMFAFRDWFFGYILDNVASG
jgi:cellulose synthase/poly-beta-1,6-N-acetylglucosamine synthase-like glycosyltransferase